MSVEYKQKNQIPNLYDILGIEIGVCTEPNCNEIIHKAYVKKAKACHPDKYPGRADVEEVFQLITGAYDILRDEKQRTAYNHKLAITKQSSSDFNSLKKSTTAYAKSMGEYKEITDDQKISFKQKMALMNSKQGHDTFIEDAISQQDAKKKLSELSSTRSSQDVDLKPDRLFDNGHFDIRKFNAAFDTVHNRDENAMISHNGVPSAWNDIGSVVNYSTFDNLDNLYVEDNNRFDTARQSYSNVEFGKAVPKITKDDIINLKGADYVDNHNVLDDEYYQAMKAKLQGRKADTSIFDDMVYDDFDKNDTAGYGIFDQLGLSFNDRLKLDVDEDDIAKKYERLISERQKDQNGVGSHKKSTRVVKGGR